MRRRLAPWMLLAALSACDAPRPPEPAPPSARETPAPAPLSRQQVDALSAQCDKVSQVQFRREWKVGAEMASHYNVKLKTCFYLVTAVSSGTLRKLLVDANGGELYGEFLGPEVVDSPATPRPKACRIESFYCASAREWDVLAEPYMQD